MRFLCFKNIKTQESILLEAGTLWHLFVIRYSWSPACKTSAPLDVKVYHLSETFHSSHKNISNIVYNMNIIVQWLKEYTLYLYYYTMIDRYQVHTGACRFVLYRLIICKLLTWVSSNWEVQVASNWEVLEPIHPFSFRAEKGSHKRIQGAIVSFQRQSYIIMYKFNSIN